MNEVTRLRHHRAIRHATTLACLLSMAAAAFAADESPLDQLAWLSGCWNSEPGEAGSGEQWTPVAGGSLLGISRTVRRGATVAFEFMRIAPGADGKLVFFAQPSGKPAGSFALLRQTDREVVFENLEHDFPQRVIYRFEPPASLRAAIEGPRGGTLRRIDFPMQRVSCDALLARPPAAR